MTGAAHSHPLAIEISHRGGAALVTLSGSCGMDVSNRLRDAIARLLAERPTGLIVDMSRLDFIDSTGIGAIVGAYVSARRHNGQIRIVNPQPAIRDVFEVTRLVQLIPIDATLDAALAACGVK